MFDIAASLGGHGAMRRMLSRRCAAGRGGHGAMRRIQGSRRAVGHVARLGALWCALTAATPGGAPDPAVDPGSGTAPGSLGVRLGGTEGRMHPYVDVDSHWVRNPGRLAGRGIDDLAHTARAGFDLRLPSPTLALDGDGHIEYVRYWGVANAATRALSSAAGRVDLSAVYRRDGPLTLRLREQLVRSADPANQTITQRLLHLAETAALGVDVRPGGGALVLSADYSFFYDRFDRAGNALLAAAALDNMRHTPALRVAWKFLPKTALFVEAQMALTRFSHVPLFRTTQTNLDSDMLTAHAGVAGNISRRLSVVLKGGYGNTFVLAGADNLQTWVAQAEVSFAASEQLHLRAGAQRTIQPTSLFRYYALTGGFVAVDAHLASGTAFALRPGVADLRYGSSLVPPHARRHDFAITCDASVGQRLTEWLTVSLVERLDLRRSDYDTPVGNTGYLFNDLIVRLDARY